MEFFRFRFLTLALVVFLNALSGMAQAQSTENNNAEANRMFVEAVTLYRQSTTLPPGQAVESLTEVRRLFDEILTRYSDSRPAEAIQAGGSPGGVDLAKLPSDTDTPSEYLPSVQYKLPSDGGSWFEAVVPGGRVSNGYGHGQYPSEGAKTHPGVDIGGGCDLPIIAPAEGKVVRVVSAEVPDSDLQELSIEKADHLRDLKINSGNAIVLDHGKNSDGKSVYTIYLHMSAAPANNKNVPWSLGERVKEGEQLGRTGETGFAHDCHTHFEVRHFEGTRKIFHPKIGKIYLPGNSRNTALPREDWSDPENWIKTGRNQLVGLQFEPISEEWGPIRERWTRAIVVTSESLATGPCDIERTKICFTSMGYSDATSEFLVASWSQLEFGGIPLEFKELGKVDFASVSHQYWGTIALFLNGVPNDIAVPDYPSRDLAKLPQDAASKALVRRYPQATGWGSFVRGHRKLPTGGQRFSVETWFTDSCRACDHIGSAVAFIDFDEDGRQNGGRYVGMLDRSDIFSLLEFSADLLSQKPKLLQYLLNSRGYDAGTMDGYPGPQTRTALMEFQAEFCLPPTGQPDSATVQALLRVDGFSAPCAGTHLPEGVSANTPLLSGIDVDDLAKCNLENLPYENLHLTQRIIRGNSITWGGEGACGTTRTDIRDGSTLFRGTCSEGNESNPSRWRFNVLSNESFVDLDMLTAVPRDATPRRFSKCPDDSKIRKNYSAWFGDSNGTKPSGSIPLKQSSVSFYEPQRGSQIRADLMNVIRPIAERAYGVPVEFVVDSLRVSGDLAYASVFAQRPGGRAIDISQTDAYFRKEIDALSGDPNKVDALLMRFNSGWVVQRHYLSTSEAWWLDDCPSWKLLFPETCHLGSGSNTNGTSPSSPTRTNEVGAALIEQPIDRTARTTNSVVWPCAAHINAECLFEAATNELLFTPNDERHWTEKAMDDDRLEAVLTEYLPLLISRGVRRP